MAPGKMVFTYEDRLLVLIFGVNARRLLTLIPVFLCLIVELLGRVNSRRERLFLYDSILTLYGHTIKKYLHPETNRTNYGDNDNRPLKSNDHLAPFTTTVQRTTT